MPPMSLEAEVFRPLYSPNLAEVCEGVTTPTSIELVGCVSALISASSARAARLNNTPDTATAMALNRKL